MTHAQLENLIADTQTMMNLLVEAQLASQDQRTQNRRLRSAMRISLDIHNAIDQAEPYDTEPQ